MIGPIIIILDNGINNVPLQTQDTALVILRVGSGSLSSGMHT